MKWVIITISLAVVGIVMLNVFGGALVSEITQEVALDETVSEKAVQPEAGKKAPYFELSDLVGKKFRFSELSGFPAVLTFWTTWNPDAANQIKIIDDLLRSGENLPFRLVVINSQENNSVVSNFLRRGGYNLPVLIDESGSVSELYRAHNLPVSYFLDAKGIARAIFIGTLDSQAFLDKFAGIRP